jgi:protein-tyrosine phosphatase
LDWRADSRALNPSPFNIGPISRHCLQGLRDHGFAPPVERRFPQRLTEDDLSEAELVIAVKEAEHRQLLRQNFPTHENLVEYWHVHDLDCAEPETALPELLAHVRALVARLQQEIASVRENKASPESNRLA